MNELLEPKAVISWLFAAVVALGAFFLRRMHNHIDDLRKNAVTREELKEVLDRIDKQRETMHAQNREDLHYIRERVDSLVDRE